MAQTIIRAKFSASSGEWTASVSIQGLRLPATWRPYGLITGGGASLPDALRDLADTMEMLAKMLPGGRLGAHPTAQLEWLRERGL